MVFPRIFCLVFRNQNLLLFLFVNLHRYFTDLLLKFFTTDYLFKLSLFQLLASFQVQIKVTARLPLGCIFGWLGILFLRAHVEALFDSLYISLLMGFKCLRINSLLYLFILYQLHINSYLFFLLSLELLLIF